MATCYMVYKHTVPPQVEGGQYQELETFKGAQYEAIKPKVSSHTNLECSVPFATHEASKPQLFLTQKQATLVAFCFCAK